MRTTSYESRTSRVWRRSPRSTSASTGTTSAVTGCDDGRWLAIFVRDGAGELTAGLHGWTWGRHGLRANPVGPGGSPRAGLGARLLEAAEQEAARRGCREMQLDTHSYQAPGFYRRRATSRSASCRAGPRGGATRVFFRKAL